MIQDRTAIASRVARPAANGRVCGPFPRDPPELKRMSRSETRLTRLKWGDANAQLPTSNAQGTANAQSQGLGATRSADGRAAVGRWELRVPWELAVGSWEFAGASARAFYATSRPGMAAGAAPAPASGATRPRRGQLAARPAIAAAGLVLVHAVVGAGEQALVVLAVGRERRAAGAQAQRHAGHAEIDRPAIGGQLQLAALGLGFGRVAVGEHDDELVAGVAGADVVGPQRAGEELGDALQRRVAGRVPVLIVDALELVEVEHDQRQRPVAAPGPGDLRSSRASSGSARWAGR